MESINMTNSNNSSLPSLVLKSESYSVKDVVTFYIHLRTKASFCMCFTLVVHATPESIWLGLDDLAEPDNFVWQDGSEVRNRSFVKI